MWKIIFDGSEEFFAFYLTKKGFEVYIVNESGITSQYGFLFQRKVFVLYVLENMNVKQRFSFEGKDDVEISEDEKIYELDSSESNCVQVKSGKVDKNCFSKVIGNWLLLDCVKSQKYTLFVENELEIDMSMDSIICEMLSFVEKGKSKKKTSIANKIYEQYKDDINDNESNKLKDDIRNIVNRITIDKCSMDELDLRLETVFFEKYCTDILEYDIAKKKRLEKFIQDINKQIDESIKRKKTYSLVFAELIKLIVTVSEEISDKSYTVDVKLLKPVFAEKAKMIVNERKRREVNQLFLVNSKEEFVLRGIVNEIFYKDFREVFAEQKSLDISNLEEFARENYDIAKDELGVGCTPKKLYDRTTVTPIDSDILPKGSMYRNGCYIYLTSDEIDEDLRIGWGEESESK